MRRGWTGYPRGRTRLRRDRTGYPGTEPATPGPNRLRQADRTGYAGTQLNSATAAAVSSAIKSMLIAAPAISPAAAEVTT
jgi:hypothetical protein